MSNLDVKKVIKALELCRYDPDPGQEPKYSHSCMKCPYGQPDQRCAEMFNDAITLLKRGQWTPFSTRALTAEEKAEHPDWVFMLTNEVPEDEQEILVSRDGKLFCWVDTFINNGTECYLDSGDDFGDDIAWMPMPEPYKEAKEHD